MAAAAPAASIAAAPLLRPAVPRAVAAVAAVAVSDDSDPPWGDEEPDILEDDLPAPTRSRFGPNGPNGQGGARPPAVHPRAVVHEAYDEPDIGLDEPVTPRVAAAPSLMPPPLPQFERTTLGTRWYELIKQCSAAGTLIAMVRALAMQSQLIACETEGDTAVWRLCVALETLRNPALADKLAAMLRGHLGHELRLVVDIGDPQDTPLKRDTAETDRRQRLAIDTIQADPTVRALLAQFQTARILPGSIKPL